MHGILRYTTLMSKFVDESLHSRTAVTNSCHSNFILYPIIMMPCCHRKARLAYLITYMHERLLEDAPIFYLL